MKLLFKKIFIIILLLFATSFLGVFAENIREAAPLPEQAQTLEEESLPKDEGLESFTTKPMAGTIDAQSATSPYGFNGVQTQVDHNTKGELARMMFMFLKVMFAVVICSVIIYFLLLFVRKFYGDNLPIQNKTNFEDNLKSTNNETDALKTFLSKTKSR